MRRSHCDRMGKGDRASVAARLRLYRLQGLRGALALGPTATRCATRSRSWREAASRRALYLSPLVGR